MGPLSRLSWSVRALIFVAVMLVLGIALDFSVPFWIAAGTGVWIGVAQWRREQSETDADVKNP